MAKRSTNLNRGHKPLMKPNRVLDLMRWLGMTDEEIKQALEDEKKRQDEREKGAK